MTDNRAKQVEIGARLRSTMEDKGLSARSLAIALEERGLQSVNRTTIGDYLAGRYSPTAALLLDIADVLGVTPGWLLTGEGPQVVLATERASTERWGWLSAALQERIIRAAQRASAPGQSAEEAVQAVDAYLLGALHLADTRLAPHSMAEIAARCFNQGAEQDLGDVIALLVFAFDKIHTVTGKSPWGGWDVAARYPDDFGEESVAPSVVTSHKTTKQGSKQPKKKKG
ncbi:MAG: helix-turn-helix domain-containing protein [Gemmatimonas sp.]|nr:helix-turn-helix domain-containing protein [Gemmatimonas sp.]